MEATATADKSEPKLRIDKIAAGPIVCLRLQGTIDEGFDGKKLAATLKGGTLVLDLAEIRKISSFGIREWVDFITSVGERVEAILLVECAPKVVDQLNMVANFAGAGRVYSFYAPYRCDYCDAERRRLLQVDRDFDAIHALKPPEHPCESCGNPEYFDEDPASFFSTLATQARFELDGELAAFLSSRLNYAVSDGQQRLRADKHVEGRFTLIKLSGDLDKTFPRDKLAEGLEGVVVLDVHAVGKIDPAGAASWRDFLSAASTTCEEVHLVGCPPPFIERLARPEDLGKAQVISFTMPYACARCATTSSHPVDVHRHYDLLKFATPPEVKCPDCGGPTQCAATEALLSHLPRLSRPAISPELERFLKAARERKAAVAVAAGAPAPVARRSIWITIGVAAAAAAIVAAAVVLGTGMLARGSAGGTTATVATTKDVLGTAAAADGARPAWITSDARATASCAPEAAGAGWACVGVSTVAGSEADARAQALDAATDELVAKIGAGIAAHDASFKTIAELAEPARQRALASFESAKNGDDRSYDAAHDLLVARRRAVADAARRAGAPKQAAAVHVERYPQGRFLGFARVVVPAETAKVLQDAWTAKAETDGAVVMTVFPGLLWRYAGLESGAVLVALDPGPLRDVGLAPQDVILSVQGRAVASAAAFASTLGEERDKLAKDGGTVRLVVKTGDGAPREFALKVDKPAAPNQTNQPGHTGAGAGGAGGGGGGSVGGTGVNIWDRTGGGDVRDNPNE